MRQNDPAMEVRDYLKGHPNEAVACGLDQRAEIPGLDHDEYALLHSAEFAGPMLAFRSEGGDLNEI